MPVLELERAQVLEPARVPVWVPELVPGQVRVQELASGHKRSG